MHGVEELGLLKMDFLGLANLTIIEETLKEVKKNHGVDINIDDIPLDDKKTFKLLQDALTTGVFQLESSGMKRYLKELKPNRLKDIIAMVALYRPGPMDLIPQYIACKKGTEPIKYIHPLMEKTLSNTYGVIVYQEQVMDMATELAGLTKGQGYLLIKAVGKKIKSLLDEQKDKFINGCLNNKINQSTANKAWELIEPFARYGFNKAHSTCYATIAYQTAYLKANYPEEFMAAFMNSETGDIERVSFLIEECKQMGIEVLPPDINESFEKFAVVNYANAGFIPSKVEGLGSKRAIRFGLTGVKNVGENVVKALIQERQNGQFKTIDSFVSRIGHKDLNKKSLESLIKCGAADSLGERNALLANLENLLSYAREKQKHSSMGQVSLFGDAVEATLPPLRLASAEPAKGWEKLIWEKELLGLYVSDHPLNSYQTQLKLEKVIPIKSLTINTAGKFKIAGVVTKIHKIVTKNGRPMIFSDLEDLTSKIELVVFPNVLEKNPEAWKENNVVIARGSINDRDGTLKFLCDEVTPLVATI